MISMETWKFIECWTRLGHFLHLLPFKCDPVERRLEPLTYSGHAKAFVSYHCMLGLRISFQIWCIVICTRNMIRLNIGWSLDTVFMITFTALHFLQLLCDLKFRSTAADSPSTRIALSRLTGQKVDGLTNLAVTLGVVLTHCNSLRLWMRRTVWYV